MHLIGITGRARSGKDTAARILRDLHGYRPAAFAEPLKKMAAILCDEAEALFHDDETKEATCHLHGKTRRHILQLLGTECVKPYFGEGVWIRHMFRRINTGMYGTRVVITDVRFEPEADAIIAAGGVILKMHRHGGLTGEEAAHSSEAGIDPDKVDFNIFNNGSVGELGHELEKIARFMELNR